MWKMIFPIITEEDEKLPFYVTSIGSQENQHRIQRPAGYPYYHLLYCSSGKGNLLIDGKKFSICENTGFFFQPNIPHEYFPEMEPWTTWWITFDGFAVKELLSLSGLGRYDVFNISEMDKLHRHFRDILTVTSSTLSARCYDASLMLYKFLLELKSCFGDEALKTRRSNYQQLQPLLRFIENNYNRVFSLNDLANITGVTPQHLCRIFKQVFSMSPFEYITKYRLQKAKDMLVGPGNPALKEIASSVGFNGTSYFCSVFKKHEEMTPVEFKRMHKDF